ncbi:MAG: adenosine deaminase [Pseudomonadota bacterium]
MLDDDILTPDLLGDWRDDELAARIVAMPKAEIHVHIEGAMTPETVWSLGQRNKVALPAKSLEEWRTFYAFRDFQHFIEVYLAAAEVLREPEDYAQMVEDFCAHQALQNISYSEAFLSASLHVERLPTDEFWDAVFTGLRAGEQKHGVRVALIPDISREFPETRSKVLDLTLEGRERGPVIGFGIGGPEAMNPASAFQDVFREAKDQGLHTVAHAGEADGADSVANALDLLLAERIGHGVRALEDPNVVARLRDAQVPLEVCPTSNYRTGAAASGAPHPIAQLRQEGVLCTLNSDDPPMFGTSLVGEYLLMARQGFEWSDLKALNEATWRASFLSDAEKDEALGKLSSLS